MTPKRSNPLQDLMRRRRADSPTESAPSSYDQLLEEYRQLQMMLAEQDELLSSMESEAVACPITGLANMRSLRLELERSLATAQRYGRRHALIMLDVSDFPSLAGQLGETTAEALLVHVARLIRQNIRPTDIAAHLGHGQYAIILNELRAVENATTRADEITNIATQTPCVSEKSSLHASITSGLYVFGQDDELEDILNRARESMVATTPQIPTA